MQFCRQAFCLKIATGLRRILEDLCDHLAGVDLRTVCACVVTFLTHALANRTKIAAIEILHALCPASHTADMLGLDRGVIRLGPLLGCLFPKRVIIVHRGLTGIAILTVQSAACNQILHIS